MYLEQIKAKYDKINELHTAAKGILKEFEGKDLPKEKAEQFDKLADDIEALTAEAKRLERAEEQEKAVNNPVTRKKFFKENGNGGDEGEPEGKAGGKETPEAKAWSDAINAYLRKGVGGLSVEEVKALAAHEAPAGGYLTTDTFLGELLMDLKTKVTMRQLARILPPVPSGSVITPTATPLDDATWTTEIREADEDSVKPYGERVLTPHPLSKLVKVSRTQLRNPNMDTEAWLREQMSDAFDRPEENAFISGTGVRQPQGILATPSLPVWTTATSNNVTADDLIDWVYSLPAEYAEDESARILCHRSFIRKIRKIKDDAGAYVWQPALAQGEPNRILDMAYVTSDKYPDGLDGSDVWEDNALIAVVGAWRYYWIVDALNFEIQRLDEKYATTNQVGFIGRKETDGMAVLKEAFIALRVKQQR